MNLRSEFCFYYLLNAGVGIGEEILLSVQNADYFKLLMKSSPFLKISEKYKGKSQINHIPLIITNKLMYKNICPVK